MSKIKKPKETNATQPEPRIASPKEDTMVHTAIVPTEEIIHPSVPPVAEPVSQPALGGATVSLEETADASLPEEVLELLTFRLADEEYAVDLLKVKEIIRLVEITRVPRTSPTIRGIISLRGTIVPVFDLRTRLGLSESPPDRKTRIVVVVISKGLMGLMVDEVTEVVKIKANEIEPPPPVIGAVEAEHLKGIGRVGDRMVILLDIEKAVSMS